MSLPHEDSLSILRRLVLDSKFPNAVEFIDSVDLDVPEDIPIEAIRRRVDSLSKLRSVCLSEDGWNVQKESEGLRTLYRNLEDSAHIHSIRLDGDVDAPIFTLLTLFHEIDLVTKWIPS